MNRTRLQWTYTQLSTKKLRKEPNERMAHRPTSLPGASTDPLAARKTFLEALPLFAGFNDAELHFLAEEARERAFDTGEPIFYEGDAGHTCHIITTGKVRVYVIGEDGRELSVSILGPGEIFGEMALFDDLPRSASVEAIEPARTLELHQDVLLHGLQRSPTLALSLLRALSARLRHTTEEAEGLASMTVADRLMLQLRKLSEWAGTCVSDGMRIALPMTQQELAALVGTSRESVNRALAGLRKQGKVRLEDGWIVLLDA
jgi:CRP/FNR family cyclic AMP-dependent transcriptional regulator